MSKFFARYVPPAKKIDTSTDSTAQLNVPRKHKLPEQDLTLREPKKIRSASVAELNKDDFGVRRFVPKENKSRDGPGSSSIPTSTSVQTKAIQPSSLEQDVLAKYRVTGAAKKTNPKAEVRLRKPAQEKTTEAERHDQAERAKESRRIDLKKKRHPEANDKTKAFPETIESTANGHQESSEDMFEKHMAIGDKFKKARKESEKHRNLKPEEDTNITPKPELHGLEPLPQPPEVEQHYEPPSYSTLPPWLAKADHISQDAQVDFPSLGLSEILLLNLKNKGMDNAMPIQSAVIRLFSNDSRHNGDLAVAAATGSGKTLAYVVPIIEALKDLAVTKLRGVIVVPTRELVKQVQETFNMCAEGTSLRAATAFGSKIVKEEAETLIESYEVYDHEAYSEQQSKRVDWAELSLVDLFERVKDGVRQAPNHVKKYRSKVDVLICTPGRLVEHLQTTKGFSLDDVQWLIIDEVDRLLNESYQEWLEIVMPALQSQGATVSRDKVLQDMGLEIPSRQITKVILSATMTQDLSKLNSLNLRNPKLLVLESETTETRKVSENLPQEAAGDARDTTGAFQLPTSLTETAVSVADGSDKPLHLLELLRTRIANIQKFAVKGPSTADHYSSSSDPSSNASTPESGFEIDSLNISRAQTNGTEASARKLSKCPSTLIFTHSTSSAPRLFRLLTLLDPSLTTTAAVLTRSTTSSASSRRALKAFRSNAISVLITTDRASRGLDIPNIEHVINYDVPSSVQSYVHRVGRTARAGKPGHAWTLVEHRQGRWFDHELAKGEQIRRTGKLLKTTLDGVGKDKEMEARYETALKQLGEEVEGV